MWRRVLERLGDSLVFSGSVSCMMLYDKRRCASTNMVCRAREMGDGMEMAVIGSLALHPVRRDGRVAGLPTTSRSSTVTLSWGSREGDEDDGHGGDGGDGGGGVFGVFGSAPSRRGLLNPTELCSRRNNERKLGKPMVFLFKQRLIAGTIPFLWSQPPSSSLRFCCGVPVPQRFRSLFRSSSHLDVSAALQGARRSE